jgi:hypothetical protein
MLKNAERGSRYKLFAREKNISSTTQKYEPPVEPDVHLSRVGTFIKQVTLGQPPDGALKRSDGFQ